MASSLPDDYDPASVEEGWGKMPPELLELIFAHLEACELYYPVSHTCHLWRQVVLRYTRFAGAYHRFRLDHPLPLEEPEVDWVASWEDEGFFVGSIPPGFEWANFWDAFGEDDFDLDREHKMYHKSCWAQVGCPDFNHGRWSRYANDQGFFIEEE